MAADHPQAKTPLGASAEEIGYRKWCLENRLFLNPLNDLGAEDIAARDVFSTPSIVTGIDEGPHYLGFYNQMKQEFVSARYMLFEGITSKDPHFSDREVLLYNTLDYPAYCLAVERMKAAFRAAYSLLDKVAFFLNHYLRLGIPERRVTFRTIWYESQRRDQGVRNVFERRPNLPLRGLFWLSKDLLEDRADFRSAMEPDARDVAEIRNHIEHKYPKVHDELWSGGEGGIAALPSGLTDSLAHSLRRSEFEARTLRLLKMARAALIHLSLAVHVEERRRAAESPDDRRVLPMHLDIIEDDWKT